MQLKATNFYMIQTFRVECGPNYVVQLTSKPADSLEPANGFIFKFNLKLAVMCGLFYGASADDLMRNKNTNIQFGNLLNWICLLSVGIGLSILIAQSIVIITVTGSVLEYSDFI